MLTPIEIAPLTATAIARLEVLMEPPVKSDKPTDTIYGANTEIPTTAQTTKPIKDHS